MKYEEWFGDVSRACVAALTGVVASTLVLTACTPEKVHPEEQAALRVVAKAPPAIDTATEVVAAGDKSGARVPLIVQGSGQLIGPIARPTQGVAPAAANGLELSFVDAPVADVVRTVLGDGLGVPFVIAATVQGTLTLQSAQPLGREAAVTALESALSLQGIALLNNDGVYHVVPLADAQRRVNGLRPTTDRRPGFGVYAVPLHFVSPTAMEAALQPFAPTGGILRADAGRNLLLLAGTSQEIAALLDVVRIFDVDWLAGMSFGMYPLEYVDAATVARELDSVFSGSDSPVAGVVKFVPLARLNSLMVVTPQARYLREIETWIRRLDLGTTTPGRRIYVYEVQNSRASDLAESLGKILSIDFDAQTQSTEPGSESAGGPPASSPLPAPAPAPAPGPAPQASRGGGQALKIVPNSENNSLLILASPSEFAMVEAALKRLDVRPIQVLIEASVAEVTLTDNLRWGLQWLTDRGSGKLVLSEASNGGVSSRFPGFSYLYTGAQDIQAVLNTIESVTNVRVISAPKLLVLNNREAKLQVGDQVPITTASAIGVQSPGAPIVNSVQFRDTGVILSVTPRANQSGRVTIDIAQEVSDVASTTTSGIDSPTIQQRKFATTVAVSDGETIALGGLIRESTSRTRAGLPVLNRIPLFGSRGHDRRRTELIVLLTPHVIRSEHESQQVMDELRRQFDGLRPLLPQTSAESPTHSTEPQTSGDEQKSGR